MLMINFTKIEKKLWQFPVFNNGCIESENLIPKKQP